MSDQPVLLYTIHRVEPWFRELGNAMGLGRAVTVTDHYGDGDYNLSRTFYARYKAWRGGKAMGEALFSDEEITDITARCRLLRWLPEAKSRAMILAMADACEEVLAAADWAMIVMFPMDRYVSDVLARLGARRGIACHEITAAAVPDMAMILHRGALLQAPGEPDPALVDATVHALADPLFTPAYVQNQKPFDRLRWWRVFGYFRLRAWYFWALKTLRRDPLSSHHMDAQTFLGHKPRLGDARIVDLVDRDWQATVERFPKERRLFVGLQLFPEASIDYWVRERALIDYEDLLVEVAEAFTAAGYCVVVKDHPLQFGFRQVGLIERLKAIPNIVFLPYEVSGNAALDLCAVNFTLTGTLGMQAALMGKVSIAAPCYYTNAQDFVLLEHRDEVAGLPARAEAHAAPDLPARQRRIITHLLRGSFAADFFSFKNFDPANPGTATADLGRALGRFLASAGETA